MKILVINAGSSSLKYQLLDMDKEEVIAKGNCEKIGLQNPTISYKHNGKTQEFEGAKDHEEAIQKVLNILSNKEYGVVKSFSEIDAVAHRLVNGGEKTTETTLITDKTIQQFAKYNNIAPLHNPANIKGMEACRKVMPNTPQFATPDTGFHATLPKKAFMYPLTVEDYKKYGIRKYGYHGSSHRFITLEMANVLGKPVNKVNLVIAHIGNGSSITCVKNGKSIDTTMGLTPLAGVMMGTRSGDVDPAVVEFLCKNRNLTVEEAITYLNKKSGLFGISGQTSDHRDLSKLAKDGDSKAKLALDMMNYSISKHIGAMVAVNYPDALVFTGGIGENDIDTRANICKTLSKMGIKIDLDKNKNFKRGEVSVISKDRSRCKIYVVPTNEELMMARDVKGLLQEMKKNK